MQSLCKKASQKVNVLSKLIVNAFISYHFSSGPVVCMFHSRKLNDRINRIYESVLRIVSKDYQPAIHQRNLQKPVLEKFTVKIGASPKIKNVFDIADLRYSFRNETKLRTKNIHTVRYGTETATHIGI